MLVKLLMSVEPLVADLLLAKVAKVKMIQLFERELNSCSALHNLSWSILSQ